MRHSLFVTVVTAAALAIAVSAPAEEAALFPEPLHLTRSVTDPISGATHRIDEYYSGSRVIFIRGDRTTITDYATRLVIEIDRRAGTFSRTSFEAMARARQDLGPVAREVPARRSDSVGELRAVRASRRNVANRMAEVWIVEMPADRSDGLARIEVSIDPSTRISAAAVEVMAGARFPNRGGAIPAVVMEVAERSRQADGDRSSYALPVEQIVTWTIDDEEIRLVTRVDGIDSELPPAGLIVIPDGAREVDAHLVVMQRMLDELDSLPGLENDR